MKLVPTSVLAAAALGLLTPAAPAPAQSQGSIAAPAPVVRTRPRPAPSPYPAYQDSFPATQPPATRPAARTRPAQPTGTSPYQNSFPINPNGTAMTPARPRATAPASGSASPAPHALYAPGASSAIHSATPSSTARTASSPTAAPGTVHPIVLPHAPAAGDSASPSHAAAASTGAGTAPVAPVFAAQALNRTTVVLDAAHGGPDNGSRLADNLVEKDVTLALAFKLRSLLQARGFTVVMTRDADTDSSGNNPAPLSLDDRAGVANHARAVACLLLHATSAGTGVHLYHSDLPPAKGEAATLPWLTAQAAWVPQSTSLADKLSQSLTRAGLPLVSATASVRPVDSLTCPALVVELAPKSATDTSSLTSDSYQGSVAQALAAALVFWKAQAQPPDRLQPPTTPAASKASGDLTGTVSAPHSSAVTAPHSSTAPGETPAAPRPRPRPAPQPTEDRND